MGFMTSGYAQFDSNKKFKAIPPSNVNIKPGKKATPPPTTNFPVIIPPNVYKSPDIIKSQPNPVSSYQIGKPNEISMILQDNGFKKVGDEIRDKLNKDMDKTLIREGLKEDSSYLVKIDVNFGSIRTKSKYFVIKCRDFGAIDGDLIKATLNADIVETRIELQNNYQEFRIYFKEGINIFELEALNKGLLGGNTGEFQFYDAEGKFIRSDYWENWDAGVKGKFVIIKE
jgi:hypothetical protein